MHGVTAPNARMWRRFFAAAALGLIGAAPRAADAAPLLQAQDGAQLAAAFVARGGGWQYGAGGYGGAADGTWQYALGGAPQWRKASVRNRPSAT